MLLRQLEYLAALSREQHFARAAAVCHVTQPALSAGIRRLEQELHVQIVRRGQRFEGFTPEGEEVLRWGRRMLAEREALDQTLSSMREGLVGTLRIGAIPTVLPISSLLTTPLRRQHPGVQFVLESMTSREITMRLNDFDIDVGMTYVDGEPLGRVRVVPLYEERYLFLTPSDGPFGDRTSLTWAEAAGTPLVQLTSDMQNRRIVDELLAETGVDSDVAVATDTVAAIYAHVTVMGLSSVVPHTWLPNFGVPDRTRVVRLPRPRRAYRIGLVLAGHGPESMLARALVDTARSVDIDDEVDQLMAGLWRAAAPSSMEPDSR
ncbi:LysR family transcriptional regulator [Nocardioides sambongensis]|uniref:LysR family transcriptional regulator n=1 Tax=Nocardioides sambongensis TaxID=2589074 RepID=UPI0011277D3C|nr:LysR substrate-binding domain-containing protein [Nocardioides sambongensis]